MSRESNYIKLTNILSNLLDVSREEINDDMSPENTNSWDSYNGLMIKNYPELEEKFDVSFTMEEVVSVRNVKRYKFVKHGIEI